MAEKMVGVVKSTPQQVLWRSLERMLFYARVLYHRLPLGAGTRLRFRRYAQLFLSPQFFARFGVSFAPVVTERPAKSYGYALTLACAKLSQLECKKVSHFILLPFLSAGGAEMTALAFAKAIVKLRGDGVAIIVTDRGYIDSCLEVSKGIQVLVLDHLLPGSDYKMKKDFLLQLLRIAKPHAIHNINSEVGWELIIEEGDTLKKMTKLFGSIFAFQFEGGGHRKIGYAAFFLREALPFLDGLLSDNQRFLTDARLEYAPSEEHVRRLRPIYNPCRLKRVDCDRIAVRNSEYISSLKAKLSRPRFLWAGRLDAEKRYDILLDLCRIRPDLDFIIYGSSVVNETPQLPELQNLYYMGRFSNPVECLSRHDYAAFIFTSRWEGMPNILIEMAALGVPLIASSVGGVRELVTSETGFILPMNAVATSYSRAIDAILRDPDEALSRTQRARELVWSRHSWESFERAIASLPDYLPSPH